MGCCEMAAKHTPGPWVVHPHGSLCVVVPAGHAARPIGGAENDAIDLATYAQEICAVEHPDRHRPAAETRANALLIAAAPLMRQALLAVRAACRDPDTDTVLPSATGELVEAALAAMGERS